MHLSPAAGNALFQLLHSAFFAPLGLCFAGKPRRTLSPAPEKGQSKAQQNQSSNHLSAFSSAAVACGTFLYFQ